MKLGVAGMLPGNWQQIDLLSLQRIRQSGFLGASLFIQKPLEIDYQQLTPVKELFNSADLEIAQANGWYEALVNPDSSIRQEGIRGLISLVRIGRFVEAPTTYVRPGGLNPNGHWFAHPENHSSATFDRLIESLKEVSEAAEMEGVILAIEGHVLSPLDSPQRIRDLIDAVGSPALKFNMDPVNFFGTIREVHENSRVLRQLFDLLGKDTVVGHAKDLRIEEKLVVHIDEVVIGTGVLDYELFLNLFQQYCPQEYLLIEHLPDEKVPAARTALLKKASSINIPIEY